MPELKGYPGKEAIDVPLDVQPIYALNFGTTPDVTYALTTAGKNVDVTVENLQWGGSRLSVLHPTSPLAPNTFYVLQGVMGAQVFDVVQFTTGTTAVTPRPAPPRPFMRHWQIRRDRLTSCSPPLTGSCIALPVDLMVESTYVMTREPVDGGQEWPFWFGMGPLIANLSGIEQGHSFPCVKLRTRGKNGLFSDPVVLCGDQAPLSFITTSDGVACSPEGLTLDGKLVAPDDGPPTSPDGGTEGTAAERGCSCSMLPARSAMVARTGAAMTCLAVLGAALRRRRRPSTS